MSCPTNFYIQNCTAEGVGERDYTLNFYPTRRENDRTRYFAKAKSSSRHSSLGPSGVTGELYFGKKDK